MLYLDKIIMASGVQKQGVSRYWKKITPSQYSADGDSESLSSNKKTTLLSFVIYSCRIQCEIGLTCNSSVAVVIVVVYGRKCCKVTCLHRGQFQTGNGANRWEAEESWTLL